MVSSMKRWTGKVAVVTGASAGIGAAIAEQLVEAGLKVVGLARRKDKIDEIAKKLEGKSGKLYAFATDVTKEEDILRAFEWIKQNVGPVHILINNAGIFRVAPLVDGNTKFWKEILDTYVIGLCIATREAIKDMKANNVDGHIVHINGISGHAVPYFPAILNICGAAKYAITALTETLRQELNSVGSKIKISSISPGVVETKILEQGIEDSGAPATGLLELLKNAPMLQPKDIADAVLYVLDTPPHLQVHELIIKPVGESFDIVSDH